MTDKQINELKSQGYHYWRVTWSFGNKKMWPYFCHARDEKEAVEVFNRVMASKWVGAVTGIVTEVEF